MVGDRGSSHIAEVERVAMGGQSARDALVQDS